MTMTAKTNPLKKEDNMTQECFFNERDVQELQEVCNAGGYLITISNIKEIPVTVIYETDNGFKDSTYLSKELSEKFHKLYNKPAQLGAHVQLIGAVLKNIADERKNIKKLNAETQAALNTVSSFMKPEETPLVNPFSAQEKQELINAFENGGYLLYISNDPSVLTKVIAQGENAVTKQIQELSEGLTLKLFELYNEPVPAGYHCVFLKGIIEIYCK